MSNSSEAVATAASTQPWGSTSVRPENDRLLGNFKDKTEDADERDPDARGSADQRSPAVPEAAEAIDLEEGNVEEMRALVHRRGPQDPSPREIEEHRLTGHAAYRSWCSWCVAGRGVAMHHSKSQDKRDESAIAVVSFDYFYMGGGRQPTRNDEESAHSS